jgi:hypothetical protein
MIKIRYLHLLRRVVGRAAFAFTAILPLQAAAAPDEIVVFTDEFEKTGEIGVDLHFNYAAKASRVPGFPGEQAPHHVFRFMPEVVWGLAPTWNLGLHIPMSHDFTNGANTVDGIKIRLHNLHTRENVSGGTMFWGANYEVSSYRRRISEMNAAFEVRGILGWRSDDWMVAINPILIKPFFAVPGQRNDIELDVFGKVMRTVRSDFAVGLEHYSNLGRIKNPDFGPLSGQTTYLVAEYTTKSGMEIHAGVGQGWTSPVDTRVYKVLLGLPF